MASTPETQFETALRDAAAATDALLEQLLSASASPRLLSAMRYAALGAGKRLRPFLVIESARLFNVPAASALRVGAALECVHCYSLVHDDLPAMDDDDLRRGKPTAHKKFDEATAILAGDSLLTLAFEILAHGETHADAEVRSALVLELAQAAGMNGMAGGQMLDIEAEAGAGANAGQHHPHSSAQDGRPLPLCLRGRSHHGGRGPRAASALRR